MTGNGTKSQIIVGSCVFHKHVRMPGKVVEMDLKEDRLQAKVRFGVDSSSWYPLTDLKQTTYWNYAKFQVKNKMGDVLIKLLESVRPVTWVVASASILVIVLDIRLFNIIRNTFLS